MKRFFQKMSEFLKYGAVLTAGGFYIWAIVILINDDNWIGISALTTMLLALAAFWSIWHTGHMRRKDIDNNFKSRLMEEIRVWAYDARKFLINEDNLDNPIGTRADKLQTDLENIFIPNLTITRSAAWLDDKLKLKDEFRNSVERTFDFLRTCINILKGDELIEEVAAKNRRILAEQDKTYLGASLRTILETVFDIKAKHKL